MIGPDAPLVVLGIGNVLLRDDGAGVHVVRELERLATGGEVELPPGTRLVDGGTLGRNLVPVVAGAGAVLFLDAVDTGEPPGALRVVDGEALTTDGDGGGRSSGHGVDGLVGAALLAGVPLAAIAVVGIQPGNVAVGEEPTPAVRAALPAAAAAAARLSWHLDASGRRPRADEMATGIDVAGVQS